MPTVVSYVNVAGTSAGSAAFGGSFVAPTAGQLEIVTARCAAAATITTPASETWNTLYNLTPDRREACFWRIVPAGPTNNTFGLSTTATVAYSQWLISDYDPNTPIETGAPSGSATASASIIAPTVTAARAASLLCSVYEANSGASAQTITLPAGQTAGAATSSTASAYTIRGGYETVSFGPTGTRTATASASQPWGGHSIVVNPPLTALTDTAAAADSLVATPAKALTDTAGAADSFTATPATVKALPADAGTGTDALASYAQITLIDTATAADTVGVTARIGLADSAATADPAPSVRASVPITDSAATADPVGSRSRFQLWTATGWQRIPVRVWDGVTWRTDIPVTILRH